MFVILSIIFLLIGLAFFIFKCYSLKLQLRKVKMQLDRFNVIHHHTPLSVALLDKDLEALTSSLNNQLRSHKQYVAQTEQQTSSLRQTIANMSHDLRTPLTSILGYIQLLKTGNLSSNDQAHFLSIAEARTKHLQSLLNDFFELSVIETSQDTLTFEPINLSSILEDMLLSYYDHFQAKGISTVFALPEQPIFISGSEDYLCRILDNLLNNSCKYGGLLFHLKATTTKDKIQLHLTNEAGNLTSTTCDKVFDRFYMADQSRVGEGVGLGLCIVQSLVVQMKGTINCKVEDSLFHLFIDFPLFKK